MSRVSTFQPRSGVYFLRKDNQIVYVGSSVNTDSRLNQHMASARKKDKDFDCAQTLWMSYDKEDLRDIENGFIWILRPSQNKKFPRPTKAALGFAASVIKREGWPSDDVDKYTGVDEEGPGACRFCDMPMDEHPHAFSKWSEWLSEFIIKNNLDLEIHWPHTAACDDDDECVCPHGYRMEATLHSIAITDVEDWFEELSSWWADTETRTVFLETKLDANDVIPLAERLEDWLDCDGEWSVVVRSSADRSRWWTTDRTVYRPGHVPKPEARWRRANEIKAAMMRAQSREESP